MGAAPGHVDQADRHAQLALHAASEVVRHGTEGSGRLGLAHLPGRRLDVVLRYETGPVRDLHMPDLRQVGGGELERRILRVREHPLHVGLPGADPYVADQHIAQHQRVGMSHADLQLMRAARRQRWQQRRPAAVAAGLRLASHAAQRHPYRLPRRRRAPDADRRVALQHHVVAEDAGQFHVGHGGRAAGGKQARQRHGQDAPGQPERQVSSQTGVAGSITRVGGSQLPSQFIQLPGVSCNGSVAVAPDDFASGVRTLPRRARFLCRRMHRCRRHGRFSAFCGCRR